MHDQAVAEERGNTVLGPVVKLIRQDDVKRPQLFLKRADGAGREDPFDTEFLETINVMG